MASQWASLEQCNSRAGQKAPCGCVLLHCSNSVHGLKLLRFVFNLSCFGSGQFGSACGTHLKFNHQNQGTHLFSRVQYSKGGPFCSPIVCLGNPPECLAASFRNTSSKCVQVSHILTRLLGNLMVVPPEASGALGLLHGLRLRLTSHPAKCLCFCDPRGLFQKMSLMRAFLLGRGQWEIRQKQKLLIGLVYFCSLGIQAICVVDFGSQGTSPQVDVLNVSHTLVNVLLFPTCKNDRAKGCRK